MDRTARMQLATIATALVCLLIIGLQGNSASSAGRIQNHDQNLNFAGSSTHDRKSNQQMFQDENLELVWPMAVPMTSVEMAAQEAKADTAALSLPPLPKFNSSTVYVGHMVPDVDSISSSVAAAYLFGGRAMRAGPINLETKFLLEHFNITAPELLENAYNGEPFVLVDHNAYAQRSKVLDAAKIEGIFDHHAISATPTLVVRPIYVNIRPWGSCATVIATKYLEYQKPIPSNIAGLLMGGIISDTLNLKSPTTTEWDEKVLHWLASKLHWADGKKGEQVLGARMSEKHLRRAVKAFSHKQFEAKANTTGMPLRKIMLADFKTYFLRSRMHGNNKIVMGWGTVETVQPFYNGYLTNETLREIAVDVLPWMRKSRDLESAFISIVDIEKDQSVAICSGQQDCDLLKKAFPHAEQRLIPRSMGSYVLTLTPRVSRKDEFIPPIRTVLQGGTP